MNAIQRLTDLTKTELAEILSELTGLPESHYDCETVWTLWDLDSEVKRLQSEF